MKPTLEDALHEARRLAAGDGADAATILGFLEALAKFTDREGKGDPVEPRPERDWFIIEGAYQKGFEFIDDDAELLVVHQQNLMNFVNLYRDFVPPAAPGPDCRALLVRYMARVIDIESVSYVTEGLSYGRIDFEGADLAALQAIEAEARDLANAKEPARAGDAITDAMLEAAAKIDDLDDAVRSVMYQVGITTGDVAGMVFSGLYDRGWWLGAHQERRLTMLHQWRASEQALGELAPEVKP